MYLPGDELLLALILMTVREATSSAPTYQWTDHETGIMVQCQQCPPGTFVAKHCTYKSKTECQPCPDQHYTQYWNYLDKCRFCNIICQDREEMKHECNATHNRVCECQPGYQRGSHFCVKVRECGQSSGLSNNGDPDCDRAVIDFIVDQNMSYHSFRRLEQTLTYLDVNERRPMSHKKIRGLLRYVRDSDPDHPLLPRLLDILKKAKLHSLEKKLRKRFLNQDATQGHAVLSS
ncbi:tumor necrosis factor receptor superfamily member 6B [Mixophyes fleayi]|uniref:tumor necrosis factor receptor superfamily member 6B n=1 Tax=Mixophyes fleayi TaxID=3061075 RepID=UPI003F4E368B